MLSSCCRGQLVPEASEGWGWCRKPGYSLWPQRWVCGIRQAVAQVQVTADTFLGACTHPSLFRGPRAIPLGRVRPTSGYSNYPQASAAAGQSPHITTLTAVSLSLLATLSKGALNSRFFLFSPCLGGKLMPEGGLQTQAGKLKMEHTRDCVARERPAYNLANSPSWNEISPVGMKFPQLFETMDFGGNSGLWKQIQARK